MGNPIAPKMVGQVPTTVVALMSEGCRRELNAVPEKEKAKTLVSDQCLVDIDCIETQKAAEALDRMVPVCSAMYGNHTGMLGQCLEKERDRLRQGVGQCVANHQRKVAAIQARSAEIDRIVAAVFSQVEPALEAMRSPGCEANGAYAREPICAQEMQIIAPVYQEALRAYLVEKADLSTNAGRVASLTEARFFALRIVYRAVTTDGESVNRRLGELWTGFFAREQTSAAARVGELDKRIGVIEQGITAATAANDTAQADQMRAMMTPLVQEREQIITAANVTVPERNLHRIKEILGKVKVVFEKVLVPARHESGGTDRTPPPAAPRTE